MKQPRSSSNMQHQVHTSNNTEKHREKMGGQHICSLHYFFCSMNSSSIGNDEKNKTLKALLHFMQMSKGGPQRYRKKWERSTETVRKLG
jgi:hypothetical protein